MIGSASADCQRPTAGAYCGSIMKVAGRAAPPRGLPQVESTLAPAVKELADCQRRPRAQTAARSCRCS